MSVRENLQVWLDKKAVPFGRYNRVGKALIRLTPKTVQVHALINESTGHTLHLRTYKLDRVHENHVFVMTHYINKHF